MVLLFLHLRWQHISDAVAKLCRICGFVIFIFDKYFLDVCYMFVKMYVWLRTTLWNNCMHNMYKPWFSIFSCVYWSDQIEIVIQVTCYCQSSYPVTKIFINSSEITSDSCHKSIQYMLWNLNCTTYTVCIFMHESCILTITRLEENEQ